METLPCILGLFALSLIQPFAHAITAVSWDFTQGLSGWTTANTQNNQATAQGYQFDTNAADPRFTSPAIAVSNVATTCVLLRMSSTADNNQADLFYGTTFNVYRRVRFTVITDGAFHDYVIPTPALQSGWRLRLDPTEGTGRIVVQSISAQGLPNEVALDNGVVKLKMDLQIGGGAITFFGTTGSTRNLVNNADRGRQVQQSYYAGDSLNRQAEGQRSNWSPWPWNPIEVGDSYGNSSRVIEARMIGQTAYTKTIPLLWDMNNEAAECTFEKWVTLEGNVAHVQNRLDVHRTDSLWADVGPRDQELPAVYTITELPNLKTYLGSSAWTNGPLTSVTRIVIPGAESFPWNSWPSAQYPGPMMERWAATVDGADWGVGVFTKSATTFAGGQVGNNGGTEFSSATKYMSPLRQIALAKSDVFEYDYYLILGTLDEIRSFVYAQMGPEIWNFDETNNLEGWTANSHLANLNVANGQLGASVTGVDPALTRDHVVIAAPLNRYFHMRIKNQTAGNATQIFWQNENGGISEPQSLSFVISRNDTEFKDYVIDMSLAAGWVGTITTVRVDPVGGAPAGSVLIDGMAITNSTDSPFPPIDTAVGSSWVDIE